MAYSAIWPRDRRMDPVSCLESPRFSMVLGGRSPCPSEDIHSRCQHTWHLIELCFLKKLLHAKYPAHDLIFQLTTWPLLLSSLFTHSVKAFDFSQVCVYTGDAENTKWMPKVVPFGSFLFLGRICITEDRSSYLPIREQ